jgi:hypothetical protein
MLASTPSVFFAADQDWIFRVRSWDTPQTVLEDDTASEGMRLRVFQPTSETTNWAAYVSGMRAAGTDPTAAFVNAQYVAQAADGRWPLVQTYWGSGAPNWWGGAYTGRVALCFSGTIVPLARRAWLSTSDQYTFALAGSGWVRVDAVSGGQRTTLFNGELSEPLFLGEGFRYSDTHTFTPGTELQIYYVQSRSNPWGGLVVKAIPGARPAAAELHAAAAQAPVVSAGLFSHGGGIAPTELPFINSVSVSVRRGEAGTVDLEVPLLNPAQHDGHGWIFHQQDPGDPGELRVFDGGTLQYALKRKRMIQVQIARRDADPEWLPLFTGHVHDFGKADSGKLTIQCVGFPSRMVEQYEQAPDRISYMARGYRVLDYQQVAPDERKQPVYNVPAFDNWPLPWAVQELATRAGLDPSRFKKLLQVVDTTGEGHSVELPWGPAQKFSGLSLSGEFVRLPRSAHYGNVGLSFTELRPIDDDYMFKVEPTKDLWGRSRELTDRLGYVWGFDAAGDAVLQPASSPSFVRDLVPADATSGSVQTIVDPAAFGAKYLRVNGGSSATLVATVAASRIDVSFPRTIDARPWTVVVRKGSEIVSSAVITPAGASETPDLFFSSSVVAPGANATMFTAYSGDYGVYSVTLTASANAAPAYADCLICYAQDPDKPLLPVLSTTDAASSVTLQAQQDEVRNKVTIVGRRKAAVTDSDKFAEAQAPTEQEFVVQNSVDVGSIVDPNAPNYIGYAKQSVIFDESIADDGLARYLAQVFIYRQRVPRAGASVQHTILPMLELGDPVAVEEATYQTAGASSTQYVSSITHTIRANNWQTSLETNPWPDYPAYQPRTDINLADFDYQPVINMSVNYTTLSGHALTDPSVDQVKQVAGNAVYQPSANLSGNVVQLNPELPWPPVPGTLQVSPLYGFIHGSANDEVEVVETFSVSYAPGHLVASFALPQGQYFSRLVITRDNHPPFDVPAGSVRRTDQFYFEIVDEQVLVYFGSQVASTAVVAGEATMFYFESQSDSSVGWLSNNPYHRFVEVDYKDTPTVARLQAPWQQCTGTLPRDPGITHLGVRYRSLFPTAAKQDPNGIVTGTSFSPFYDPYTSELGNLVRFQCSVLAEGLYRVSIRNWDDDTVVAWLTNPTADPLQEGQHWEYVPVLANRQFTWDGVDQVGLWNALQSELYAELVEGTFDNGQRARIGRGFYCWNRELAGSTMGPQAYIWMQRRSDGTPIIGHGTFARWYIHVEAQTTMAADPEVSSKDTGLAILTHLPSDPIKLELKIEDWDTNTNTWVAPAATPNESSVSAVIHNQKPIRIRFRVAPRPGALWAGKEREVSVKLTREVHLRAVIGDQTVLYSGKEFPGTVVEDRTIYNRRLVNDEHTKRYTDTGYRKAATLRWDDNTDSGDAATEWVFRPSDFKKDFRIAGLEESIQFGNYLQLEEVPGWNGVRELTAARSRLNFALMSYLFYFSAHVTDRSGRSSWGINRSFVDKSKIFTNTTALDWPVDATYEQRRTVVCRQWTQESGWRSGQLAQFGYGTGSLMDKLLESFWWQHDIISTTIGAASPTNWSSYGLPTDPYAAGQNNDPEFMLPLTYILSSRQLGTTAGSVNSNSLLGKLTNGTVVQGNWSWEAEPYWIPSITRDLHPYFMLPPMAAPVRLPEAVSYGTWGVEYPYRKYNCYWTVGGTDVRVPRRRGHASNTSNTFSVSDAAAAETWTSPVRDYTAFGSNQPQRFWPGKQVDVNEAPFKDNVPPNAVNYVRQNEMVHWEELRGIYSRNAYPTAAAVKVPAAGPYYINPHRYALGLEVGRTLNPSPFPQFHVKTGTPPQANNISWFRLAFRSEYVWESGSMFPATSVGKERLDAVMWWRHRFVSLLNDLAYDTGSWVGWKDDLDSGWAVTGAFPGSQNPFATGFMPVGAGPLLPVTTELTCHLVLVPSRRGSL